MSSEERKSIVDVDLCSLNEETRKDIIVLFIDGTLKIICVDLVKQIISFCAEVRHRSFLNCRVLKALKHQPLMPVSIEQYVSMRKRYGTIIIGGKQTIKIIRYIKFKKSIPFFLIS